MYWALSRGVWIASSCQAIPPQLPGLGSRLHLLLICSFFERIWFHMMQPEFQVFWSWHCDSSARYGGKYHHVLCIAADWWVVDSCLLEPIQRQGTDRHRTLRLAYNGDKAALIWQFVPYFCGATSLLHAGLCLRLHFLHWRHIILEQLKHLNTLCVKQLAQFVIKFVTQFVIVIGSKLLWILIDCALQQIVTANQLSTLSGLPGSEVIVVFLSTASDGKQFYAISQQAALALPARIRKLTAVRHWLTGCSFAKQYRQQKLTCWAHQLCRSDQRFSMLGMVWFFCASKLKPHSQVGLAWKVKETLRQCWP